MSATTPDPTIQLTIECTHRPEDTLRITQLEQHLRDQEFLIQSLCRQLASTMDLVRGSTPLLPGPRPQAPYYGPSYEISEFLAPEIHLILKAHGLQDVIVHDRTRERDLLPAGSSLFLWQLAITHLRTSHHALTHHKETL